jgi:hypothetical protein
MEGVEHATECFGADLAAETQAGSSLAGHVAGLGLIGRVVLVRPGVDLLEVVLRPAGAELGDRKHHWPPARTSARSARERRARTTAGLWPSCSPAAALL